jgi:hypothetical protein
MVAFVFAVGCFVIAAIFGVVDCLLGVNAVVVAVRAVKAETVEEASQLERMMKIG